MWTQDVLFSTFLVLFPTVWCQDVAGPGDNSVPGDHTGDKDLPSSRYPNLTVGDGLVFYSANKNVAFLGATEKGKEEDSPCCKTCQQKYLQTSLYTYIQSGERYARCECYGEKLGIAPSSKVFELAGSGECGKVAPSENTTVSSISSSSSDDISGNEGLRSRFGYVKGGLGSGRVFFSNTGTVKYLGPIPLVDEVENDTCCRTCQEEYTNTTLYTYIKKSKRCECYEKLPNIDPSTEGFDEAFAGDCELLPVAPQKLNLSDSVVSAQEMMQYARGNFGLI